MSSIIQRPRRITSESVPAEQRQAVDLVGASVNTFMEEVYIAIMGRLGPDSNLNMEFKTLDVEVDSNGIPKANLAFTTNLSSKVIGIQVVRAFLANPTAQPFMSFSENVGIITVNHIAGLTADTKYQLVILLIGS